MYECYIQLIINFDLEKTLNENMHSIFLKADWSVCAGNWSWISSGSPDDALYDMFTFCPVQQGIMIDPDGEYTK